MWSSRALVVAVPLVLCTACVEHALLESISPTEHELDGPLEAAPPAEGSVWRGTVHSGSFLYFDRKARGLGDLVTVVLVENLSAAGSANTTLDRTSGISAAVRSELGLADLLVGAIGGFLKILGIGSPTEPASLDQQIAVLDSTLQKEFEGDGETNRASSFRGVVTCRVVEALPGNLFRVYGKRKIVVNHELQLVTLEGLVRQVDIGIDNRVPSSQLADVKLTFDGIGVLDDEQRPALFARVMSWLYPW